MSDCEDDILKLQKLILSWLSKHGARSLESIRQNCGFLLGNMDNSQGSLNSVWKLFWPLVYSGVVDHIGNGYYSLTEPLVINYGTHYIYTLKQPKNVDYIELTTGIYLSSCKSSDETQKEVRVNPVTILKKFPSLDKIVESFIDSNQDEQALTYYNRYIRRGIARLGRDGVTRYYSNPEIHYMKEVPDRAVNPEAFSIAYCLSKAINGEPNGFYNVDKKELVMSTFAMPIMIYRVLLLHTLTNKELPTKEFRHYVFKNIEPQMFKELNRIFCKSIRYE